MNFRLGELCRIIMFTRRFNQASTNLPEVILGEIQFCSGEVSQYCSIEFGNGSTQPNCCFAGSVQVQLLDNSVSSYQARDRLNLFNDVAEKFDV